MRVGPPPPPSRFGRGGGTRASPRAPRPPRRETSYLRVRARGGSTRVRETGLRRARLSAHPSARIGLLSRFIAETSKTFFPCVRDVPAKEERKERVASTRERVPSGQIGRWFDRRNRRVETRKGIVFIGISSDSPMKRVDANIEKRGVLAAEGRDVVYGSLRLQPSRERFLIFKPPRAQSNSLSKGPKKFPFFFLGIGPT